MTLLIRPRNLDEYIAEPDIKNMVNLLIKAAKIKKEPPPHLLISGPPGTGKTSLVYVIAAELGVDAHELAANSIEKEADIRNALLRMKPGDIFYIDEIHSLKDSVFEVLYKVMEDFKLPMSMNGRNFYHQLPPFTLMGTTTDTSKLAPPLYDRFRKKIILPHATHENLITIISNFGERWYEQYNVRLLVDYDGLSAIAAASRSTPRIATTYMDNCLDYFIVNGVDHITRENAVAALLFMGIDEEGLTAADRRIIQTIFDTVQSGSIAGPTLAAILGISKDELANQYEPYLISKGYIMKGPGGRSLADNGFKYISRHN